MSTTGLNGLTAVAGKTAQATTAIMCSQMGDLSLIILAGEEGTLSTCSIHSVSTATYLNVADSAKLTFILYLNSFYQYLSLKVLNKIPHFFSGDSEFIPHFPGRPPIVMLSSTRFGKHVLPDLQVCIHRTTTEEK